MELWLLWLEVLVSVVEEPLVSLNEDVLLEVVLVLEVE